MSKYLPLKKENKSQTKRSQCKFLFKKIQCVCKIEKEINLANLHLEIKVKSFKRNNQVLGGSQRCVKSFVSEVKVLGMRASARQGCSLASELFAWWAESSDGRRCQ